MMVANTEKFSWVKNKYLIAIVGFLIWMAFFDPKDWGLIYTRTQKLKALEKSELELTGQIAATRKELYMLKSSAENIERFAREKYLMKRDNEDVFTVKTP